LILNTADDEEESLPEEERTVEVQIARLDRSKWMFIAILIIFVTLTFFNGKKGNRSF